MLTALGNGLRFRLAFVLALFAAICFVAPPAVLAMGHGKNTVHCLANADAVNHGGSNANGDDHHAHQPSPAGQHSGSLDDRSAPTAHKMTCCGLFCLSAVAPDDNELVEFRKADPHGRAPAATLLPREPHRIDRPPILLLLL